MPENREKKKQLCLHIEKKKQAPFSPACDLCVLISKCVPKKSIYMLKKRKKEKKGEVYLMWLVMHPNFFVCSIFLLVLPSPTLWLLSMVPQQSLLFFFFKVVFHCWKQCFVSFGFDMSCERSSAVYLHGWRHLAAFQSGSLTCDTWRTQKLVFLYWLEAVHFSRFVLVCIHLSTASLLP